MDMNVSFRSKLFKGILIGIAGLILLLLAFKAGTMMGFRKAGFSYKWGENYHRNFGGPRGGFFGNFSGGDFMGGAHGVFGQLIKIDGTTLVMKDNLNAEKIVLIKSDTAITGLRENVKPADLKVNDNIVVIGEPNDAGQIEAKFIRLMPPGGPLQRPANPRL